MLTRFKNRFQELICLIVFLMLYGGLWGQPSALLPEADFGKGLPSNNVLAAMTDKAGTVWVGTDKELSILGDPENKYAPIQKTIGIQEVWSIAFQSPYVFVGSRYNGVYIFNVENSKLVQHFDKSKVGLCRRLRSIGDSVLLATNALPFYFSRKGKEWKLHPIKGIIGEGFFTDFAGFDGRVYAACYMFSTGGLPSYQLSPVFFNQQFYELKGDSIVIAEHIAIRKRNTIGGNTLSLFSNDESLFIGGDGFYQIESKQKGGSIKVLKRPKNLKEYPVWDVCALQEEVFLAIGDPGNMQEGLILHTASGSITDMKPNFYGQSLSAVNNQDLLIGSANRGLFLWKNAAGSISFERNRFSESSYYPLNENQGLLFDPYSAVLTDWTQKKKEAFFKAAPWIDQIGEIMSFTTWNDTIAMATGTFVLLLNYKGEVLKRIQYNFMNEGVANKILKTKRGLVVFSQFRDFIFDIDIQKGKSRSRKLLSNDVNAVAYKEGAFYSSANGGFHYYDGELHNFTDSVRGSKTYCIQGDTLWVLKAGILNTYRIDLKNFQLRPLFEVDYQNKVGGFYPLWITQAGGNVWIGHAKGMLMLDHHSGNPKHYVYLGNYEKAVAPTSDGKYLYFSYDDVLTKIDASSLVSTEAPDLAITQLPDQKLFELNPFKLLFKTPDYFFEEHSLKELALIRNGKPVDTLYTIDKVIEFPNGLRAGDYTLDIKANGKAQSPLKLSIHLPLTSSPYFYAGITLLLIGMASLAFRTVLLRRSYEKQILNNRLQLLKQNLNPHFIFNSLNLIYSLVLQKKNDAAAKTIADFADLHRYYLDNINKPKIELSEELKFIESYLKLEAGRVVLDNQLVYWISENIDEATLNLLVPPMILQPLVENAVKYAGSDTGKRSIWIDVEKHNREVVLGIENTLATLSSKQMPSGNGLGLKLVEERIDIYNTSFGEKVQFIEQTTLKHCEKGYRSELIFAI